MEPTNKPRTTPKDFFLYLGVMIMLYSSILSLLVLLFDLINHLFPDALNPSYGLYSDSTRWPVAVLFVVFPVYILGTWYINKDLRNNPDKQAIGIRRWLTYLALFFAGLAIIGDLVALIYTFLGGEVTARFGMKVLAILVVAGYGFYYYYLDLRGRIRENPKLGHTLAIIATIGIIGSIVFGFAVMGTPGTQRALRLDQSRTYDLQNIQYQIVYYWQQHQALPKSLADLNDPISNWVNPKDPETGAAYEYTPGEGMSFQVCATFARPSTGMPGDAQVAPTKPMGIGDGTDTWTHGAGRQCFERVIDPQRYPPINKNVPDLKVAPPIPTN